MTTRLSHETRRRRVWRRAGRPGDYLDFIAAQFTAYNAQMAAKAEDRGSYNAYSLEEFLEGFTSWLERRFCEEPVTGDEKVRRDDDKLAAMLVRLLQDAAEALEGADRAELASKCWSAAPKVWRLCHG